MAVTAGLPIDRWWAAAHRAETFGGDADLFTFQLAGLAAQAHQPEELLALGVRLHQAPVRSRGAAVYEFNPEQP